MFFPDLIPDHGQCSTLTVGWLEPDHDFPRGPVTTEFLDALFEHCEKPHVLFMGYHRCRLDGCMSTPSRDGPPEIERSRRRVAVGYSDFFVERQGLVYYSPSLIYHYVADHQYLPPQAFREAVLLSDPSAFPKPLEESSAAAFLETCERSKRATGEIAKSFPAFDPALAVTLQGIEEFAESVNLDDYIDHYRKQKMFAPIGYAGYIHPCYASDGSSGGDTRSHDPYRALRDRVTASLLSGPMGLSLATDELIADLFCASVQFGVAESRGIDERLAIETLRRKLYRPFVSAYQYPLGMDQGMPLELALQSRPNPQAGVFGLLAAFEELAKGHAVTTREYANLAHWARVLSDRWSRPNPLE